MFDHLEIQPLCPYVAYLFISSETKIIKESFMIFDTWNLLLPVGVGVNLVLKKYKGCGINKEL
jgi:hypothetical protein